MSIAKLAWALATALLPLAHGAPSPPPSDVTVVNETTCGDTAYKYLGLEGYGFVPSNAIDKFGDTLGGFGSSVAIDQQSWRRTEDGVYEGVIWALPDRGWNTNGTLNVQARVHKFAISLTLAPEASADEPSKPNLNLKYLDTILFSGPDGQPTTGLDADFTGGLQYDGFPILPAATYVGDGFGGAGPGGKRITIDCEGLVLGTDGTFWVSDEYGPYVYHFSATGRMLNAIQPPQAILPRRNDTISFSAASPPAYDPAKMPNPEDTETGRSNNQGFEGLTGSVDGKTLYVLVQSALDQEGGPKKRNRRPARFLEYDISDKEPRYVAEHVVELPTYIDPTEEDASKAEVVASQSEIHRLPSGDFLVLARDSGLGHGQDDSQSVYRHADVFSINGSTTDLKSDLYDSVNGSIASSKGVLNDGIVPAEYCSFLDFNVADQLAKFGLHNGGAQDASLLNEKWESLATVPVNENDCKRNQEGSRIVANEYFLFSFSDNDYITQDGHLNFGNYTYKDSSGYNLDSQVLIFRIAY